MTNGTIGVGSEGDSLRTIGTETVARVGAASGTTTVFVIGTVECITVGAVKGAESNLVSITTTLGAIAVRSATRSMVATGM